MAAGSENGLRELLEWSAQTLGAALRDTDRMWQHVSAFLRPGRGWPTFAYEVHHDGSERVDLAVFTEGETHPVRLGGGELLAGPEEVHEFDLLSDGSRLAGVFRPVARGRAIAGLEPLGAPLLVARLTGRGDQWRLIFPVREAAALEGAREALLRAGAAGPGPDALLAAAPLCTTPSALRLAIDFLPDRGTVGRVGLEVFLDPGVFDVFPVLARLGVPDAAAAGMRELADRLPARRSRARAVPGMPSLRLPPRHESIGLVHFSVSWPGDAPVVKSYAMVRAGPAAGPAELAAAAVHRHAEPWPDRLRWARRQLALRPDKALPHAALRRWEREVDPAARGLLQRRLARDGLTTDTAMVAVSPHPNPDAQPPAWWPDFVRLQAAARSSAEGPEPGWFEQVTAALPAGADRAIPFAHLLWPVAADAWGRVGPPDPHTSLTPDARADLLRALLLRLSEVAAPALSEAFWEPVPLGRRVLARAGGDLGAATRDRYAAFCRDACRTGLSGVLLRYPVLGGQLAEIVRQWRETVTELLERIGADRAALEDALLVPADRRVSAIRLSAGDTHNGGRTVCLLAFGDRTIVYKPRSVRLERLYQDLVTAARDRAQVPLRAAATLPRTGPDGREYGYMEYVGAAASDAAGLGRFYRSSGAVLAVLHALAATDCHHENLVAHAGDLVLIDAETLFDAAAPAAVHMAAAADPPQATAGPATVLRTGLLPSWMWLQGAGRAVEISALGAGTGDEAPVAPGWRAINTDRMRRDVTPIEVPRPTTIPVEKGPPPLAAHLEDLLAGFRQAYRLLADGRDDWLPALLDSAGACSRRMVTRPTYVYAGLLAAAAQPSALRSEVDRGMVLERLTRAYLEEESAPLWPLVGAEMSALGRAEIPYFSAPVRGGRAVWWGGSLAGWPPEDSLDRVTARLAGFGEEDLAWQCSVVRAAVGTASFTMTPQETTAPANSPVPPELAGSIGTECLAALTRTGLPADGHRTWMGVTLLPDGRHASLQSLGTGLYDGRLGLAVAMSAWWTRTGVAEAHRCARDAIAPVVDLLTAGDEAAVSRLLLGLGTGYNGAGGLLRGLRLLARSGVVDGPALAAAQASVLAALHGMTRDRRVDHMSGAAGVIRPLVGLRAQSAGHGVEDLIRAFADTLVEAQGEHGGWRTLPAAEPLTGLAHGASGISLALAEAAVSLGEEGYLQSARRGLAYEASVFDAAAGNWPDLRSGRGGFMLGWCGGAPGIALVRARLGALLPDAPEAEVWRRELAIAAASTAAAVLLPTDHLCCGNLGRVAVLRQLTHVTGDPRWASAAERIVDAVLARTRGGLPRPMLPTETATLPAPGLFTGLPGMGAALLQVDTAWWSDLLL